ncbi:hypothetical protein B0H14DRAFT_688991 [Mycena olivaceomarginata]|nr:hypothetical protein B0H14DRAFT_688991 [Mycena olivaceomarginata]
MASLFFRRISITEITRMTTRSSSGWLPFYGLWTLRHIALCVIAVYSVLVLNFNKPDILQTTTWSMNVQTDFNGLIGLIVEVFYARRVWIVSRNIFLTVIIVGGFHSRFVA